MTARERNNLHNINFKFSFALFKINVNFDFGRMSFEDFLKNWEVVQICHLSVDCFSDEINESGDVPEQSLTLNYLR